MRRVRLTSLLIASAGTATAQVPVAFVIPSGGEYEVPGAVLADSAEYVVEYLNDRGGQPAIDLAIFEDGCDEDRAREIAIAFAGDGWEGFKPEIVLGHCPDVLGEVAEIYAVAGVPFFSPFAPSDERIYQPNASVFQVEPDGWLMAERTVDALQADLAELDQLRGEQVGVLTDETAYTQLFANILVADLSGISGGTSIASTATDLGDAQVVFYAGTDAEAYDDLLALSEAQGTRLVFVRRGIVNGYEWFRLMDEAQGRGLDVRTVMPAPQYETDAGWDYRLPFFHDTTAQLVMASFELAMQALAASGGDARDVPWQVRSQVYPTILGPLRSGEIGKVGPLHAEIVTADEWLSGSPHGMHAAEIEPPAPPVDSAPVYNLEIEPLVESSPIVLEADAVTELSFFIGGSTEANVLGEAVINLEDIQQLAGDERLAISVTLNCLVCETENYRRRGLMYNPAEGRSLDTATFKIVPKRDRVDPKTGMGLLLFVIDARGIDLDVIQVPVFVGTPTPEQRAAYQVPAVRAIHHEGIAGVESPDLVVDITDAHVALDVILMPKLPELVDALRAELGTAPEEWKFKAGASKDDVDDLVREAYLELRAMINQHEDILQRVYETQGVAVVLTPGAANLDIEDSDRDAMLRVLRKHGARLYKRVFLDADRGLRRAMRLLEHFTRADGQPLSVRIRATNVYAPWQLMYPKPGGEIVTDRFWGLRYALGTRQIAQAAPVSFATVMDPPDADETLFAAYRAAPGSSNQVAARARLLADHVAGKVGAPLDLVESKDEFLDRLGNEGRIVRLLVAYGHASSGTDIGEGPAGSGVIHQEVAGARFMLAANEAIKPLEIEDKWDPEEGLLLASQPIVIFNACETGSGGARPANNNGFVGVLTRAGARAVIVTETPVWNNFAYHFGVDVIDSLFDGKRVDVALRDARLRHLETWNNPLGLVYTLYGNSAARITLPDDGV